MAERLIGAEGVSYAYGKGATPAVREVSLTVEAGRITGLVGPDGAGKTTLLRLMAGLLRATGGRLEVCGFDPATQSDALHACIGYMPQRFGLYDELTVAENLSLFADLHGIAGTARIEAFGRLLAFTGLAPFTARLAGRLSGGMKQKLGLACALIRKPRLLLLDEPSVGVDPVSRRELWRLVRGLVDPATAVVWSTAYLDEAGQCDDIVLLNGGRLLFAGKPEALTARVAGRVAQVVGVAAGARRRTLGRLLEHDAVLDGVVQGSRLRLLVADRRLLPSAVELGIAGDDVRVEPVAPRFEDAFLDILGVKTHAHSSLAARMPLLPPREQPVVVAEGLVKRFGSFTAVDGPSFTIRRGEVFGLLGPNGAGKSTTFKMLCGLLRPSSGTCRVAGVDLRHAASRARARLGYMAQKFSLYGDLTVAQNLGFFAGIYGLAAGERREAVGLMAEVFALGPFLGTPARELPLGFKQRLSLACAVMHRPDVLFLDEPTSGVDPVTRREFWTHINGLVEQGVTILVTTHFMDEAEYCDRVVLIDRGRAVAEGTPDALKAGVRSAELPDPTLEDAFVAWIRRHAEGAEAA